jgi:hypothetical protein
MNTIVSRISRGCGHELLNKLEAAGLTEDLAQRVIDFPTTALAATLVSAIQATILPGAATPERAQRIMGKNIFGVDAALASYTQVSLSATEYKQYARVPYSETVLRACRTTHVLVAVLPLKLGDIVRWKQPYERNHWHKSEKFSTQKHSGGWYLVRKSATPGSLNQPFDCQFASLRLGEAVPDVNVVLQTSLALRELRDDCQDFGGYTLRCADRTSIGTSIAFRCNLFNGAFFIQRSTGECSPELGLASYMLPSS